MNDHQSRTTVFKQVLVIRRLHPWIDGNGDRANLDGAEKSKGKLRAVRQAQEHPFADSHP